MASYCITPGIKNKFNEMGINKVINIYNKYLQYFGELKMINPNELKIKIFADGAEINTMKKAYYEGMIKGFTTNPSLLKKAGVINYENFAKEVLNEITDLPISFEVFADDFYIMEKEAKKIASWGNNVNVKIPITNTRGESSIPLINKLIDEGININITAILTIEQIKDIYKEIPKNSKIIVSIFAGRIADTGRDPIPYMMEAVDILKSNKNTEVLWASSRELLNIFQAQNCGCHIITVTPDILSKLQMYKKNLTELSLETVRTFYNDAKQAGYKILS